MARAGFRRQRRWLAPLSSGSTFIISEVDLEGPVDPASGMVLNLADFDELSAQFESSLRPGSSERELLDQFEQFWAQAVQGRGLVCRELRLRRHPGRHFWRCRAGQTDFVIRRSVRLLLPRVLRSGWVEMSFVSPPERLRWSREHKARDEWEFLNQLMKDRSGLRAVGLLDLVTEQGWSLER